MLVFLGVLCLVMGSVQVAGQAVRPYMGWSSWSLQSTLMPGYGNSFLQEANILRQIDIMATKLSQFGYTYINMDSGWSSPYDQYGRPLPDLARFPRGIKFMADYAHAKGLKLGIYAPVGLPMGVFGGDQSNKVNFPVKGSESCTGFDLVYEDWRTTNGWDSSYKMDFTNPCSALFIDSIAEEFAEWGIDFFKLDGVGPGSWKEGPNYDNRPDVAAWRLALQKTGRDILLELSWQLDIDAINTWTEFADGWRIDTDVECYCETLVKWTASVVQRFTDLPPWIQHAGPGRWNDLDTLNVGNGTMDGLTDAERQTYATLWIISCAPLYMGEDLAFLDEFGLSLLTNREALDINQNGMPASPVEAGIDHQVWWSESSDGTYVLALFNIGEEAGTVTAHWSDLGTFETATVRNVWSGQELGTFEGEYSLELGAHASQLLRVTKLE